MSQFGFPSQANYAQSQVSNVETNYNQVENGGLFTRDECRNLARYLSPHEEKLLRLTMEMEMEFVRQLKWPNGWLIVIEQ